MIRFLKKTINYFFGSIHRELLITFLFVLVFVVLVFGGFSINALVRSNRRIIESNVSTNMNRLIDDLSYKMNEIERITDQIIIHEPSQEVINNPVNSAETVVALKKSVFPHLSGLTVASPVPTSIALIIDSETIPERILGGVFNDSFFDKFAVFSLREENRQDYKRFGSSRIAWYCDEKDQELGTIAYGRRILDTKTLDPMGFVMGRIRLSDFFSEFSKMQNTHTYVYHSDGRILFSTSGSLVFDEKAYGAILEAGIPGTPWSVISGVRTDLIREGTWGIFRFSIIIGSVVILFAMLFSSLFTGFFSNRIEILLKAMNAFREGDFSIRVQDPRQDEIAGLSNAFNHVVEDMEKLLQRIKESEREKKKVELNLLKAQINPHFLYNSLSSIGHLSKMGRKDETYKLILAVSKFYRLTLNKGNLYIPLGEELQRIMTYLEIQKMKYRERLIVSTSFDNRINDILIPDFILQPFLENSFAHGWRDSPLTITLSTEKRKDHIMIRISDDGIGMEQSKAVEMMNRESPSGGFGIYYVRKRLESFYQGGSGLFITTEPGEGMDILISLPIKGALITEKSDQPEYYDMYSKLASNGEK